MIDGAIYLGIEFLLNYIRALQYRQDFTCILSVVGCCYQKLPLLYTHMQHINTWDGWDSPDTRTEVLRLLLKKIHSVRSHKDNNEFS